MVEVGVSARDFSLEMALPINENEPMGGDVSAILYRNVLFREGNDEAGSMGLGGVSAREFSPEGALPVNENDPSGGEVSIEVEVSVRGFSPEGALPVVDAWEFSQR